MKSDKVKHTDIVNVDNVTSVIPDLDAASVSVIDYGMEYYTPNVKGEKIRGVYLGTNNHAVQSFNGNTDEVIPCVEFLIKDNDGFRTIYNGSKRLVGAINQNAIKVGSLLELTYQGKRKNKTNAYTSDSWSIRPLIIEI